MEPRVQAGQSRHAQVIERIRSRLVHYLAGSGDLARHGYVRLPDSPELPRIETREQWESVLDDLDRRLATVDPEVLKTAPPEAALRLITDAFSAAMGKIRSDLAWTEKYREAGTAADEEDLARTAPSRL